MKFVVAVLLGVVPCIAQAQFTEIPDPNFEQELINDGIDSEGILDGRIPTADAATVSFLNLAGTSKPDVQKITDLTGIEDFTALKVLRADGNLLSSVDLSQNLDLEELQIQLNNLTSLDVSTNTQLTLLYANNNNLSSVSGLDSLSSLLALRLDSNPLTSIDTTSSTGLSELRVQSCSLQLHLDLSHNPNLTTMTATTNPDLLCIEVEDVDAANAGLGIYAAWTKPATAAYSENCEAVFPTTAIPDDRFEDALIALGHDSARDNRVLTANISGLTYLDVNGESISSLVGIQDFASLTDLDAGGNNLVGLDLSQNMNLEVADLSNNALSSVSLASNAKLTDVDLSSNSLTSLNVTMNPLLETLDAAGNQLTSLDVGSNPDLSVLDASGNQLTGLDLSAPVNLTTLDLANNQLGESIDLSGHPILTTVDVSGNPGLLCIQVDDAEAAAAGTGIYTSWSKDGDTSFAEDCSNIFEIFSDGFESGTTNGWSQTEPPPQP